MSYFASAYIQPAFLKTKLMYFGERVSELEVPL